MTPAVSTAPWLLSMALRALPLAALQLVITACLGAAVARRPDLFQHLGPHANRRFGIDPTDMPFAFELRPLKVRPRISVLRKLPQTGIDARVSGPLLAILGPTSGTLHRDALFFSRDLVMEGDVAAVVALHNALDDAGIDLVALAAECLGPLGLPLTQIARPQGAGWRRSQGCHY